MLYTATLRKVCAEVLIEAHEIVIDFRRTIRYGCRMSDIKRDPKSQTGGMGHQLTAAPDVELTPDQLRVLLFDEWEKSCMLFPGGSDWLKTLAEYPFNYKLPKLLDVAIKSWWVWGVPQSPGMRQIARYMLDRWDD